MRRGKLDRTLRFEKPGQAQSDGQQRQPAGFVAIQVDDEDLLVPAQFVPKLGKEEYRNAEQKSSAPALFRFSYHPELAELDTKWRVYDGSEFWYINSVVWSGRTVDHMEIQCMRETHK